VDSKDDEVRHVTSELDALLEKLAANVDALNGILTGRRQEGAPA
jgi:hypothetical protein